MPHPAECAGDVTAIASQLQLEGARLQLQGKTEEAIRKYRESVALQPNPRLDSLIQQLEGQRKKEETNPLLVAVPAVLSSAPKQEADVSTTKKPPCAQSSTQQLQIQQDLAFAYMCECSYGKDRYGKDRCDPYLTKLGNLGWKRITENVDAGESVEYTPFKNINTKEIAIAFRGTEGTPGEAIGHQGAREDWQNNLGSAPFPSVDLLGRQKKYKQQVEKVAEDVKRASRSPIIFTGHSKGGGEALWASKHTGDQAVVFNPRAEADTGELYDSHIARGYYLKGEALSFGRFRDGKELRKLEPVATGLSAVAKHEMNNMIASMEAEASKDVCGETGEARISVSSFTPNYCGSHAGSFDVQHQGKAVSVWYYFNSTPTNSVENTIVLHNGKPLADWDAVLCLSPGKKPVAVKQKMTISGQWKNNGKDFYARKIMLDKEQVDSGCCYLEISAGKSIKEYYLSKTGLFSINGKTVIEKINGGYSYDMKNKNNFRRLPIQMVKIFPKSTNNDFLYIEACDESFCAYQYIISKLSGTVKKTSAGKYGTPGEQVSWSPNGSYLIVPYGDDGNTWIYLIRVKDGKSWAVFNDDKLYGQVDFSRITWINETIFEIPAYSCAGVKLNQFGECDTPNKETFPIWRYNVKFDGPDSGVRK